MSGLLTEMCQASLDRFKKAQARESEQALWNRALATPPAPPLKLSPEGFDVIAECKLHSPSAGDLSGHTKNVESRVQAYAKGGACAVSVLTEPVRFGGQLEHLAQAAQVLAPYNVPCMRKDFLVHPYQVMEARAAGAGGVLVIGRMLDRTRITELIDCAAVLKMFVLVEGFDREDLAVVREVLSARKQHSEQILVGVNCRDLQKLTVEIPRLEELVDDLPDGLPRVAESGVRNVSDARFVVGLGYQVALVGTALMNSDDPCRLLGDLLAAGRERAIHRRATD